MEKRNLEKQGLYRLSELKEYEVANSDPDIRGWEVYSNDEKNIGKINELIVDPELMKVRYLDLHLNIDIESGKNKRNLLIPIGSAELDEKKKAVYLTTIETVTLLKMPEYGGGPVSRDYEKKVRNVISPDEKIPEVDSEFYNSSVFDENRFYKTRSGNLSNLKDLDPTIYAVNHRDVRGWEVLTKDGANIGFVHELIIDTKFDKIRYLDVEINKNFIYKPEEHVLIPIGLADINFNDDKVLIDYDSKNLKNYPAYGGGIITRMYENSIVNSLKE